MPRNARRARSSFRPRGGLPRSGSAARWVEVCLDGSCSEHHDHPGPVARDTTGPEGSPVGPWLTLDAFGIPRTAG